ncbi:MAG: Nucleotide-binding protein, PIN protein [archaeon GW2011_AR9]|nr:MAG: Nucleotide-binding protein, PIN protein [archaeon GW2011_AR9]MBS3120444.1 PIN domain-containing protein [Candidatus Woesearchaeota archaeon]HIG93742.1 PIN domain-containing protein [Candidatus Woesearchaeota archaeon]HIH12600.1 PIN domain-containing protein [Candidatus Woesearchaeota archaeon]
MIIIIDVNVFLSALIKDSTTREIILTYEQEFCFPEKSLQKIRKYKKLIQQKSGLSDLEFLKLFHTLLKFIRIIPDEELLAYWDEAKLIMEHIDPEDVTFIAAALSQEGAIIWSDDRHFEKQDKVITLKTKYLIHLFKNH